MASILNGTGVTFSDGSTQNSANAFNVVGSHMLLWYTSTTLVTPGNTASGSYLFYVSNASAGAYGAGGTSIGTSLTVSTGIANVNRTTAFSNNNATYSPIGGTWRLMTRGYQAEAVCGYAAFTPVYAVRIA